MRPRDDGQASIEHMGVVLLVALVLLAAGAIAEAAGAGLSNRVTTAFQRALCAVGADDCPALHHEPCPNLRTDRSTGLNLSLGFLRLGDERALSIERESDGTYRITMLEGVHGGAGVTFGAGAWSAEASLTRGADAGRTYVVHGAQAARDLVQRLRDQALPGASTVIHGAADLVGLERADPAVESYTMSAKAMGDATAKLGFGDLADIGLAASGKAKIGVRVAAHERSATAFVQVDGQVGAFFDVLPQLSMVVPHGRSRRGDKGTQGAGDEGTDVTAINADSLSGGAEAFSGGTVAVKLAPGPRIVSIEITGHAGAGRHMREVHATLDPNDPAIAAALRGWTAHPTSGRALAALGQAASASAAIDVRDFALSGDHDQYGGEVGIGPSIGLTYDKGLETARLTGQRSRPVGGVWEQRVDCAGA